MDRSLFTLWKNSSILLATSVNYNMWDKQKTQLGADCTNINTISANPSKTTGTKL